MPARLCVSVPSLLKSSRWPTERAVGNRFGLAVTLLGLFSVGGATSCETVWGGLSVPAAENCVSSTNLCQTNQVCNLRTQLCEEAVGLLQSTPARGRTDQETPVTITGTNFVPGMVVKWNGTALSPVTVDSATQLHFTAPRSVASGWRVTIEVSNPSGVTTSRSDLYSYYSGSVNFQQSTPPLDKAYSVFTVGVVPAIPPGLPTTVYLDGSSSLRGVTISSDGKTATERLVYPAPIGAGALLVGELNSVYTRPRTLAYSLSHSPAS